MRWLRSPVVLLAAALGCSDGAGPVPAPEGTLRFTYQGEIEGADGGAASDVRQAGRRRRLTHIGIEMRGEREDDRSVTASQQCGADERKPLPRPRVGWDSCWRPTAESCPCP